LKRLQKVLNTHRRVLSAVFNNRMNRASFQMFAMNSMGLDVRPANEIFSCSTNLYARDEDDVGIGADCFMSPEQFTTAIVRLANLNSLMYDGMDSAGDLSHQTDAFLSSI
jgi:hypothetical protein